MESYYVYILKDSEFFWDGRKWVASPQNVRCYATMTEAFAALDLAKKKAASPQIITATLKF